MKARHIRKIRKEDESAYTEMAKAFPHFHDIRGKFRTLHGNGHVNIAHRPAFIPDQFHHSCKKDLAVDAGKLVRSVGEVLPDVPES